MVELSLMASASFSLGSFRQEQQQGLCRVPSKEFQTLLPGHIKMDEALETGRLHLSPTQLVCQQISSNLSLKCDQLAIPVPTVDKPLLVDVQDHHPESVLFSFGIAEKCIRHEKILHFLKSGSSVSNGGNLNISLLSELMDLQTLTVSRQCNPYIPMNDEYLCDVGNDVQPSLRYQRDSLPIPPVGLVSNNLSCSSMMGINPDGQVLFMGTEAEMKDILSTIAEVYMSQNALKVVQRRQMVVPYFTRSRARARGNAQGSIKPQAMTAAPSKSNGKTKARSHSKKKQKRTTGSQRDIYDSSYSQVCESLLSVFLIKNRSEVALHSLKQHGHELPQLIMQLSAGIAGTGLAVIFSVIWKLTCGKLPLCTTKLLNTGVGLGLVWLSLAANMLRDTIIEITKNASKLKLKEDEMAGRVERSVNEILFRAATVLAIVVFKFA